MCPITFHYTLRMSKLTFNLIFIFLITGTLSVFAQSSGKLYELRVYHCNDGKRDDLVKRFNDHTVALFERHGFENIGYWIPTDPAMKNDLIYIVAFPDMAAHDASWKGFLDDPDWKAAFQASRVNGPLVASIDSKFLYLEDDLTKTIKSKQATPERLFELRTYDCYPHKYPNLVKRFEENTCKLLKKHGMENIAYFGTTGKDANPQPQLVYIVAHKNAAAAEQSWKDFNENPKWLAAKESSTKDGKIVEKITSVFMTPTSFSKIK